MTLIVETNNDSNGKKLAEMLKNMKFVKEVTFQPTEKKKSKSIGKQKPLTAKDWVRPGRPATDEEIEQMLKECERGEDIPAEESKAKNMKEIKAWMKSR